MTDPSTVPPAAEHSANAPAMELFGRWLDLSELERRAFIALVAELTASSDDIESNIIDLSDRFQQLAGLAQAQSARFDRIITVAKSIEVGGEAVPIDIALHTVGEVLRGIIETILSVSKHAMRMVYALESVSRDVEGAEASVGQINKLTTQTRYLALNAAIEGNRFGPEGAAFRVIASEIKQLSQATDAMSIQVGGRIAAITKGVRDGQAVLQEIATLDMREHIMAKQKLDGLVGGIVEQNRSFTAVLDEAADASVQLARTINQLIVGIQFQDRSKQHMSHVIEALRKLAEATTATQQATRAAYPGVFEPGGVDHQWLERITASQTLGAVKQRMLTQLLSGDIAVAQAHGSNGDSGGDIELF